MVDEVLKAQAASDDEIPLPHKKFTLYWSSLERYETCPQRYLWSRGWGNIDVGGGPGRKKPEPAQTSEHHRVMGKTIAKVMDNFYNGTPDAKYTAEPGHPWEVEPGHDDEGTDVPWWKRFSGDELVARLDAEVYKQFDYYIDKPKTYVPFGGFSAFGAVPSRAEMLDTCLDGVRGYLKTLVANKLLGKFAKAEVNLIGYINPENPIGGRADLIVMRDDTGISILDGKNSMSKGKYTDPHQLVWYALCFYIVYGRLPDRVGFIYFRYPHDPETGEQGVEWIDFDAGDVRGLAQRAVEARAGMYRHEFEPTPSPQGCKFCEYEVVCEARQEQKAKRKKRKPKDSDLKKDMAAGSVIEGSKGLVELDFGL